MLSLGSLYVDEDNAGLSSKRALAFVNLTHERVTMSHNMSLCTLVSIMSTLYIVGPPSSLVHLHMCAQVMICCEPVSIIQCREDTMPFICVLWVAILLSLSTFAPKWRATSLTQVMLGRQPCTGQLKTASCPWWSTSYDPVDLMWRQLTRFAYIHCLLLVWCSCDLSGHTCCMGTVKMDTCAWVTSTLCVLFLVHMTLLFVVLSAHVHQLMWLTTSSYFSPIRFHCVSLTLCAVGKHSTFESSSKRSCRGGSFSSGEWQQCPGTEQCGLTKTEQVLSVLLSCT